MLRADGTEMVIAPVRWRIVLTMGLLMLGGACLGLILSRLIYGDWGTNLVFTLACWLVAGLVVGLVNARRQGNLILLSATALEAPGAWRRVRQLKRDEIDPAASARRTWLDAVLLRDVVHTREGEHLSLSRWSYSHQDLRRLQEALGIPVRGDGRGV